MGGLAAQLRDNTSYIGGIDSRCHGRGQILCHYDAAFGQGGDVHRLDSHKHLLHTGLDVAHVRGSLLHQLVSHGGKHIRIHVAHILNGVFTVYAVIPDRVLNLPCQHGVCQKHHMSLHDFRFLLSHPGCQVLCQFLCGLDGLVQRSLKTLHLLFHIVYRLPGNNQLDFFHNHCFSNSNSCRSACSLVHPLVPPY